MCFSILAQVTVTQIAILGTVGLPARYGGFETLADELVRGASMRAQSHCLTVWCSAPQAGANRPDKFQGARLRYLPLRANGAQSIPYDALSLWQAARSGHATALLLGVSGASALPLIRATSRMRIITHLDGLEWQRPKWGRVARRILERSEAMAVRWSHAVVADNPEIAAHVRARYGVEAVQIAYGHERAQAVPPADICDLALPPSYALALARAEPENNLETILAAFATLPPRPPLVMIANWQATPHGRALRARFGDHPHIRLLDAEYDAGRLHAIRARATLYIHGHSAGGTNPSLVEMMGFGLPVAAWDCGFNRATTDNAAAYFDSPDALRALIPVLSDPRLAHGMGAEMRAIARRRYRWADVTAAYFDLLGL
jgi:glycosyltransferase involved in cell wall biosynthesis